MDQLLALLQQAQDLSTLDDEALGTLRDDIEAAAVEVAAGDLNDETLTALDNAAVAVESIDAEAQARLDAEAQATERANAALARIQAQEADPDGDPDAAVTEEDPDEEAAPEETPAEAPAETEPAPEEEAALEPVAAAATPPPVRVSRVNARRPARTAPRPRSAPEPQLALTAAANAPGVTAGQPINDWETLSRAFQSAFEAGRGYRNGPPTKVAVAHASLVYPDQLALGRDPFVNGERIQRVQQAITAAGGIREATQDDSLVAAGGICAPSEVRYNLPIVGTDDRPVRDGMMTRFAADRGGVRTLPPPIITELNGAVEAWTEATDTTPNGAIKDCLTVTCPEEDETIVDAITRCLEFGNFRARFWPEQIEAWTRLAMVRHARFAESRLLTSIGSGSTAVNAGQILGTARDVLAALDRAAASFRSRHRMSPTEPFVWGAPFWLRDQIRTDIARQIPVGTVDETLALADASIDRWFAVRRIEPNWFLDGETGQIFGSQGVGVLIGWPSTVITYLYPAGSWLFLDGGTLDLGLVRDSTLNSTNDVQLFAETFEGAHFHGVESLRITMDVCPDGSTSLGVDINPCVSGS